MIEIDTEELGLKFYLYQIAGVLVVWLGMTFFLSDIHGAGKIIYYVVTSWLLLLVVVTVRKVIRDRQKEKDEGK